MPRPPRLQYPGAMHHVMNRGANHQCTFRDPTDNAQFMSLIERAVAKTRIEVHAYCLMGNHFHLLVRTPEPNLDIAMQAVLGVYTRNFNDRHGRDGALFRGRYKSILVDSDNYLLALSRYIHRNPAGLAEHLSEYAWSSYGAFLGHQIAPSWLTIDLTLRQAGGLDAYQRFIEGPSGSAEAEVEMMVERARLPSVIGSKAFVENLASKGV